MFNRLNCITVTYKSSHSQIFFRIGVLRNFAMFTGKHMCWSLILIKLQVLKNISDGCFCLKNTSVYNYNNSSSDHSSQYGSHLLIILSLLSFFYFVPCIVQYSINTRLRNAKNKSFNLFINYHPCHNYFIKIFIFLIAFCHPRICRCLIRLRLEIYFSHQPDNGGSFLET